MMRTQQELIRTVMTKHEIEIPGLPEGWKAVAYRVPIDKIDYVLTDDCEIILANNIRFPCLIVDRIG